MGSLRAMRSRMKSIKSTEKVTRAMKMVSVAKLRRMQRTMTRMRPFVDRIREILETLTEDDEAASSNKFLAKREINKVTYVMFVGNRGLCGAYNNNLLKFMKELTAKQEHEYEVVVVGKWGEEAIRHAGYNIVQRFADIEDIPTMEDGQKVARYLKYRYLSGETDQIIMVYEAFTNVMVQTPTAASLIPVEHVSKDGEEEKKNDSEDGIMAGYIYEPDEVTILENGVQLYIDNVIFGTMVEEKTGEYASRMTAMTAASDNTEELIQDLTVSMNRERQAMITTELSEITGGANALKKMQKEKEENS